MKRAGPMWTPKQTQNLEHVASVLAALAEQPTTTKRHAARLRRAAGDIAAAAGLLDIVFSGNQSTGGAKTKKRSPRI